VTLKLNTDTQVLRASFYW